MKVGIFATQTIEMSAPNWDSIRVQSAPSLALLPTYKKRPSQKKFTPDDEAGFKVIGACTEDSSCLLLFEPPFKFPEHGLKRLSVKPPFTFFQKQIEMMSRDSIVST